ncbi:MAG TPA: TIR domain-containing protein [Bryobacteraceae bacterium]|nr:TIR domain-containing protein [Bryobacteraceae bacterium]
MPNLTGIFISYAHKDARHLASRLQRDLGACGFEVWLDISRLAGGASWTCEIEQALDHAEVVLALLSTASFRSDICRAEQLRSQRRGKCVIPVLVHKDADRPLHLETRQYRDFSDLARYDETLKELIGDIVARSGATLPKKYGATFVTVPPLPANYIERSEELTALRDVVIGEQTPRHIGLTAVRGMAGIGKTILSQALCQDVIIQAAFPDGVIWVTIGQQPGDLVIQMREIGRALDESVTGFDTAEASASRLRTLLRDKAALLVLDNVWHADHVQAFFVNAPRCRLLFTTRDARVAMALGAHEHSLDVLTVAQALALLASRANQSIESLPPEAADVVKE